MKKILILYFSGVGNTKYIAECMYSRIEKHCIVDMKSIEEITPNDDISQYDKIILGTPTIHSEPVKPVKEFLKAMKRLETPVPAFIFATYGLYPENVLRIFAKLCIAKNEKYIEKKIERDINEFIYKDSLNLNMPKHKWYGLINYPNKWIGQHYHFKIFLHKEQCVRCSKCVSNCPRKAIKKDEKGYPVINRENCMNCYRCIYNCPSMAWSLFKKKRHKIEKSHQKDE